MWRRKRAQENRWFPGNPDRAQFVSGWNLEDEQSLNLEDSGVRGLFLLRVSAPDTLTLGFSLDSGGGRFLEFQGLADIQIDGPLIPEEEGTGWDVLDNMMIECSSPRTDGRVVYAVMLANASLVFASFAGADTDIES